MPVYNFVMVNFHCENPLLALPLIQKDILVKQVRLRKHSNVDSEFPQMRYHAQSLRRVIEAINIPVNYPKGRVPNTGTPAFPGRVFTLGPCFPSAFSCFLCT